MKALDPALVVEAPYSIEGGGVAFRSIAEIPDRPTAVICNNDLQALGVLQECSKLGLRVPRDISVTGMDDIEQAAMALPLLTTVRIHSKQIGVFAAHRIVGMIEGRAFDDPRTVECQVVLRKSLGQAPATKAWARAMKKVSGNSAGCADGQPLTASDRIVTGQVLDRNPAHLGEFIDGRVAPKSAITAGSHPAKRHRRLIANRCSVADSTLQTRHQAQRARHVATEDRRGQP